MTDREVQRFLRAAAQRLKSAQILYENGMYLDSIYLAGYAPECALKALLIGSQPKQHRVEYIAKHFRSAKAHNIEFLRALLVRAGRPLPQHLLSHFRRLGSWTTELRYEAGTKSQSEARVFLDSAFEIVNWVDRSK